MKLSKNITRNKDQIINISKKLTIKVELNTHIRENKEKYHKRIVEKRINYHILKQEAPQEVLHSLQTSKFKPVYNWGFETTKSFNFTIWH